MVKQVMTSFFSFSLAQFLRIGVVPATVLFLGSCADPASVEIAQGEVSARLTVPEQLRAAKALVSPQLTLQLNGENVPVLQNQESAQFTASFLVDAGRQHRIKISWSDNQGAASYRLVEAEEWFSTPTGAAISLNFDSSQFNSSFDDDGDGVSNLAELKADSSPGDSDDPEDPVPSIMLSVVAPTPAVIASVQAIASDRLVRRLLVNDSPLLPAANGGLNAVVTARQPAFVSVEWCYRLASGTLYRLARYARSVDLLEEMSEQSFQIPESEYNFSYDLDSDGISNIQEIASGTAPASAPNSVACL